MERRPIAEPRLVGVMMLLGVVLAGAVGSQPTRAAPLTGRVSCAGESLAQCLPHLGKALGVRLSAGSRLKEQRVTIHARSANWATLKQGLQRLLSAEPDGAVVWRRIGNAAAYRLEDTAGRRALAARMLRLDDQSLAQAVRRELQWLNSRGQQELASAPDGARKSFTEQRYVFALLARSLGDAQMERLRNGQPVVLRVGEMPGELGKRFRGWLRGRVPARDELPDSWLNGYYVVLLRQALSLPAGGGSVIVSLVTPKGVLRERSHHFRVRSHGLRRPPRWADFRFPDSGKERRVTLWLTHDPAAKPAEQVDRNLNQLLKAVAAHTGVSVIADGYLRPSVRMPANVELRNLPLDALLNGLTRPWNCDWQFLDHEKQTVLIRARFWWREDLANVTDATLERLQPVLGQHADPSLDDVASLAQLRDPQLLKLAETGLAPIARSLLDPVGAQGAGVLAWLRFYGRLPKLQQAKVRSESGLPLGQVHPQLVATLLTATLASDVGAVTRELQRGLTFQIRRTKNVSGAKSAHGWQLQVRGPQRFGPIFLRFIVPRSLARASLTGAR